MIVIDVGHGWRATGQTKTFDPGAIGKLNGKSYYEHNLALSYAQSLRDALLAIDPTIPVELLVATQSRPLTLTKRKTYQPNAHFISIHLNASTLRTATGHEVYYYRESHKPFAELIYTAGLPVLGLVGRGIKQNNYTVLKRQLPSALVELGFISNPNDLERLLLTTTRQNWAHAVARALWRYYQSATITR